MYIYIYLCVCACVCVRACVTVIEHSSYNKNNYILLLVYSSCTNRNKMKC